MRCRYKEKIITSGNREEIYIYPEFAQYKGGKRKSKYKTSSTIQAKLNEKNAIRKLSRIVNCNFGTDDLTVTLEYRNGRRPETFEQVKIDTRNYVRRLRNYYKKIGIDNFKYITIFETGEERGNYHMHIIMTGGADRNTIEKLWGHGSANTKRLQPEYFDGLDKITSYMQKKPLGCKRWIGSRNLVKPVEKIVYLSKKEALRFLQELDEQNTSPKIEGKRLLQKETIYNEVNGSFYAIIDLIKLQEIKKKCRKKD